METRILVACPTFEGMKYCQDKFFEQIKNLTYPNYDILILDNSKTEDYFKELSKIEGIKVIHDNAKEEKSIFRLISSRNKILEYGVENGYSHILMLDSDVVPPKEIIEELLKCNKDIVSGVYFNYFNISGKRKYLPVAWALFTEEEFDALKREYPHLSNFKTREDLKRHLTQEEIDSDKLYEVAVPSAGCMLLTRAVFEKARYGKFKEKGADDDIFFINQAKELGFHPYCNTKVKCDHLILEKYKKDKHGNLVHSSFSDLV
ncbi:MAG: glycosyltransferase [Nanoarchaeota archaeon]